MHWRYYREQLASEFWTLVRNLDEMCLRWGGMYEIGKTLSIFGQFALRLRRLHERCLTQPDFQIDLSGFLDDTVKEDELLSSPTGMGRNSREQINRDPGVDGQQPSLIPRDVSVPTPSNAPWSNTGLTTEEDNHGDDLAAMSEVLMGQSFLDMDRVISFDEMMPPDRQNEPLLGWDVSGGNSLEANDGIRLGKEPVDWRTYPDDCNGYGRR